MSNMRMARSVGLAICERISKTGLEFIKIHDEALYTDIRNRLKDIRKKGGFR